MESHVIIKRVERTKRKCVTTIHGLEVFGKSSVCVCTKVGGGWDVLFLTIPLHRARRRVEEGSKDVCQSFRMWIVRC